MTRPSDAGSFDVAVSSRFGGVTRRRSVLRACTALATAVMMLPALSRDLPGAAADTVRTWVAFYGQKADERMLASYDIVVLDRMFQGSIKEVAASGARVCAYLSIGEISLADPLFRQLPRAALLQANPAWPGVRRIDVRNAGWRRLVLQEAIPAIAASGFTGLMLDTLDTPAYLEQLDPEHGRGMCAAAIDLVQTIRRAHPDMLLMMNRGYALLPSLADSLDAVIAESLLTRAETAPTTHYVWNERREIDLQLSLLVPAEHHQPSLAILSLDYWDPADHDTVREIYRRERRLGHKPYVATRALDTIVTEPVGPVRTDCDADLADQ